MPRKDAAPEKSDDRIIDEPGMAERFQRALRKGAQHAAEASNRANAKDERAARIKGARSQGEDSNLTFPIHLSQRQLVFI
jgi:hypothetical protein